MWQNPYLYDIIMLQCDRNNLVSRRNICQLYASLNREKTYFIIVPIAVTDFQIKSLYCLLFRLSVQNAEKVAVERTLPSAGNSGTYG